VGVLVCRNCSFLNACLLHRYFSVVRVKGLRVMNRSHSMQKKPVPFPLRDLARMMAFSDEEEVNNHERVWMRIAGFILYSIYKYVECIIYIYYTGSFLLSSF